METKNTIFLVICVVVFVFTLTPSYALISSVLSTGGTVSAGADFKIAFTSAVSTDNTLATATINPEATSITINTNFTKQGQETTVNFVIKSIGSLSATVDNLTTINTSNSNLTATIVGLDTLEGASLEGGKEMNGSIIVRYEGTSDNEDSKDAKINIAVDYSKAIK